MRELSSEQRAIVRAGDPEMSDDPEVQRALERIPCEMAATYNLACRCWAYVTLGQAGNIQDVAIVRRLCEQRNVGVWDHQIIDQARQLAWNRLEASRGGVPAA